MQNKTCKYLNALILYIGPCSDAEQLMNWLLAVLPEGGRAVHKWADLVSLVKATNAPTSPPAVSASPQMVSFSICHVFVMKSHSMFMSQI